MPGIIAAALLTFIPAIGDYVTPDLLGGAQTTTVAKVVQTLFLSGRDWPQGSALGFILMAVTLIGTIRRDPQPPVARCWRMTQAPRNAEPAAVGLRPARLHLPVRCRSSS